MSATRLLILGVLQFKQPTYGYEVRRELESWNADRWANVSYGSIYHALKKMAEEGLIAEVDTEQRGRGPARIGYELTPTGDEEFQRLLREYWWDVKPIIDPFLAAASFMPWLPKEELVAALRYRITVLQASVTQIEYVKRPPESVYRPRHVAALIDLMRARMEAEIAWAEEVISKVERDELP